MKIQCINFANSKQNNKPYINSKTTGYIATAGIGLAIASGFSKSKNIKKSHKVLAVLAALGVVWHIYSVEYNKKIFNNR